MTRNEITVLLCMVPFMLWIGAAAFVALMILIRGEYKVRK